MEEEFFDIIKEIMCFSRKKSNNVSAKKVDPIHGVISRHLNGLLGDDYVVETKETTGKETKIQGRYINKAVDVVIRNRSTEKIVAGMGVKIPINSFFKNKNNQFENMLGETANIRTNNIPYFQIVMFPAFIPDWQGTGDGARLLRLCEMNEKQLNLYRTLSTDNSLAYYHTPVKTFLLIFDDGINPDDPVLQPGMTRGQFNDWYLEHTKEREFKPKETILTEPFDTNVIFNNYEEFIRKVVYLVKGFD